MSSTKPLRDWLYLVIVATQLLGMLGHRWRPALDLVAFYPASLYATPSSPLHFLLSLRSVYVSASGDPYFAPSPTATHEPWFEMFLYVEGLVQLPLAAYMLWQLSSKTGTSGPAELAGLVFGCLTAMGAATCCFDLSQMGPERVGAGQKMVLIYGTYLPFAVIPAFMAIDMYSRLLPRVQPSDVKAKSQ
ncbi:hypothetical protein DCS_02503 [Drechmeria coniospora]|uniref:EXPERA domain-containing protein n=1 Tax=Drechmeria coniospora TaxID=98403 RepID=A0A151GWB7_DRECN|nr:hypothetical protein DCS_02503 [Drechmeria coniospora]KYK61361.1 hypothetical protein DCS_02503 [Drechmeria coniospora]